MSKRRRKKPPKKHWSWGQACKNATGGAVNAAVVGAMMGLIDPTGATALAGACIGGATGAVGTFAGDVCGYLWDDEPELPFASIPLFNFVAGFLLLLPYLVVLVAKGGLPKPVLGLCAMCFVANMIAAASGRLIEDIRVRMSADDDDENELGLSAREA